LARTDSVSEVIWCVGFRSDGRSDKGNNTHRLGFPERRRRRGAAPGMDVVVVPAVPEPRRVHDGVQRDESVQMEGMTRSIASFRGRIARLEAHGRQELRVKTTGDDYMRDKTRGGY
jgi:hypothetical protein